MVFFPLGRIKDRFVPPFYLAIALSFFAFSILRADDEETVFNQGVEAEKHRDYDTAIACFSKIIVSNPTEPAAYYHRGCDYTHKGQYAKAITDLEQTIELKPDFGPAYNNLSCILALCPDPTLRQGKKAVEYALKACELTAWKERATYDTLAAAYAEAGDFDNAIKWENKFLQMPGVSEAGRVRGQRAIALYHDHKIEYWDK